METKVDSVAFSAPLLLVERELTKMGVGCNNLSFEVLIGCREKQQLLLECSSVTLEEIPLSCELFHFDDFSLLAGLVYLHAGCDLDCVGLQEADLILTLGSHAPLVIPLDLHVLHALSGILQRPSLHLQSFLLLSNVHVEFGAPSLQPGTLFFQAELVLLQG